MDIADYRKAVEELENGEIEGNADTLAIISWIIANRLENALWQPGYKEEAAELAQRARAIQAKYL